MCIKKREREKEANYSPNKYPKLINGQHLSEAIIRKLNAYIKCVIHARVSLKCFNGVSNRVPGTHNEFDQSETSSAEILAN